MGQIDQLLRHVAGAPVRTVLLWRSRGISWKVITSNLLPVPSLSIKHHQLLPSRAGNGLDWLKNLSVANGRQVESSLLHEMQSRSVLRPPHTTRVSASKSETVWKYLPGRNSKKLKYDVRKMKIPKGRSGIEQSTSSSCSVSSSTVLKREPPFPPTMTKPVQP